MRKLITALALAVAVVFTAAAPALAIDGAPHIKRTWSGKVWVGSRTWHPPTTTLRVASTERTWSGTPWQMPRTWHPTTYRVKSGDTLWRIAVRFCGGTEHDGQKWRQLARANDISGTTIYVGQIIRLRCDR